MTEELRLLRETLAGGFKAVAEHTADAIAGLSKTCADGFKGMSDAHFYASSM